LFSLRHDFAASLGDDKESNWLPAPEGPFSLYIRACWGKEPILDGTWQPPEIKAVPSRRSAMARAVGCTFDVDREGGLSDLLE
jgi:hypothetical protein